MRLLHVYSGNLFGGVERMLISVSELEPCDTLHAFVLCFDGKLASELTRRGAAVEFVPAPRLRNPLSIWKARAALGRLLRRSRFDAIVCHGVWAYCMFSGVVAKAGHTRVLYLHDTPEPKSPYYRWAWRTPPAVCIANSAYTAELARAIRPRVEVRVVYPLVNAPQVQSSAAAAALRASLNAERDDLVILHASRLEPLKGHENLLRALSRLSSDLRWKCWFAGSPQRPKEQAYLRTLEALVAQLGLGERVKFIGHRDDMASVLAACDVYCQPNRSAETFGLTFVEALYAGKPVLGSDLGGTREIVTSDCGILCAPAAEPIARALERLLGNAELRGRMSNAGPTRAEQLCGSRGFTQQLAAALAFIGIPPET